MIPILPPTRLLVLTQWYIYFQSLCAAHATNNWFTIAQETPTRWTSPYIVARAAEERGYDLETVIGDVGSSNGAVFKLLHLEPLDHLLRIPGIFIYLRIARGILLLNCLVIILCDVSLPFHSSKREKKKLPFCPESHQVCMEVRICLIQKSGMTDDDVNYVIRGGCWIVVYTCPTTARLVLIETMFEQPWRWSGLTPTGAPLRPACLTGSWLN